ncbi:MAG: hypothetical protein AABX70_04915 [Nanoarchaeota archaeon]
MNRMILPLVLALIIMPFALGSYRFANTPSMTGSPATAMQSQGMSYQAPPLYTPATMGVSRDVRFLPPVSEQQLQLDSEGVVTTQAGEPVTYGTTGGVINHGHNSWTIKANRQVSPYFSATNEQGFKTGVVQTNHYQKWRGRSYLTDYLGYNAPLQVLKQWRWNNGGMGGQDRYIHAGIPNLIKSQTQYVNAGIPAQITPVAAQ